MLTSIIVEASEDTLELLKYKGIKILSEGECDNGCMNCPVNWSCHGPDSIPFQHIKDFLERNSKALLDDEKLNNEVDRTNLSILNGGVEDGENINP